MLNPNYNDEDESSHHIDEAGKQTRLITDGAVTSNQPSVNAALDDRLASHSSSHDDHCHVSIDKERNKTVWYKLITVFVLCIMFMVGEIIGGILAKSISIQTDAAHMAADIAGFFFSIVAIYVSEKGVFDLYVFQTTLL